jgi:tetratricopeptide (TPR) repeat protein
MSNDRDYQYELFVSYAHADNFGAHAGKVTLMVEAIKAEHKRRTGSDLNVFFDTTEIKTADDWAKKIKTGLLQSKLMIAILSPNYFGSPYCRQEWAEYVRIEYDHCLLGEGIAPVYVIAHPDFENYLQARDETSLKSIETRLRSWFVDLKKRQIVPQWKDWWQAGREALASEDARQRLIELSDVVKERVVRSRIRDTSPNNLPPHNPNFVGRVEELKQLNDNLNAGQISAIAAVNGIGGVGKTALALIYARAYGHLYPGGRFIITCANISAPGQMQSAIVNLAPYIGVSISAAELQRPELAFRKVKAAFEQRPPSLLILDNIEHPSVIGPLHRADCLPIRNTHILVTTRCEPMRLGDMACESLDALKLDEGQRLLFRYRPIDEEGPHADEEWRAALEIAKRLGSHALALEIVAVRLALHPEISYVEFLNKLATDGLLPPLDAAGGEAAYTNRVRHAQTLIGPLLKPTLDSLEVLEVFALEYAAFLPPDNLPVPWIQALVEEDLPDRLSNENDAQSPWRLALERLNGLRLLVAGHIPELARCHRLVQEVVRARLSASSQQESEQRVLEVATRQAGRFEYAKLPPDQLWVITALRDFAFRHCERPEAGYARVAQKVARTLSSIGNRLDAKQLALAGNESLKRLAQEHPDDPSAQYALAVSYADLASLSVAEGKPTEARDYLTRRLEISHQLVDRFPAHVEPLRSLAVSYELLGDLSLAEGKTADAIEYFRRGLVISETMAGDFPDNLEFQRDLSIAYDRVGNMSVGAGKPDEALDYFQRGLKIRQSLASRLPEDADALRGLMISYRGLADLSITAGKFVEAREHLQQRLKISERLASLYPHDLTTQHDLFESYDCLGGLCVAEAQPAEAQAYFVRCVAVCEKLIQAHPDDSKAQRDLSNCFNRLGELSQLQGNLSGAKDFFTKSLEIGERLATALPDDANARLRWSGTFDKMGELHFAEAKIDEAAYFFTKSLEINLRAAHEFPQNTGVRSSLACSFDNLGLLYRRAENLTQARDYFVQSLHLQEELAREIPDNALIQGDLCRALDRLGELCIAAGDLAEAWNYSAACWKIRETLANAGPTSAGAQLDLAKAIFNLGQLATQMGERRIGGEWLIVCYEQMKKMRNLAMPLDDKSQRAFEWLHGMFGPE